MMVDPIRAEVMNLLAPIPQSFQRRVRLTEEEKEILIDQKVMQVRGILEANPVMRHDSEIFGRVLILTERSKNRDVQKFRRELVFANCCKIKVGVVEIATNILVPPSEMNSIIHECKQKKYGVLIDGRLTIPIKTIESLEEEGDLDKFWDEMKNQNLKKLTIQRENGKPFVYEEIILNKLVEKKPPLRDFVDEYTLEFGTGELLTETKATLLLCGEFFEGLFRSSAKEVQEKIISLPDISLNGFSGILSVVESGKLDAEVDANEYKRTIESLLFKDQAANIPQEGVYGKTAWEKNWGMIRDMDSFPHKEALEPSPINKDKRMIDDFFFFWMPPEVDGVKLDVVSIENISKSEKFGEHKIGYEFCYDPIRSDKKINESIKNGYWFAMAKVPIEVTRSKDYQQTKDHLEEKFSDLLLPTTREALIYCLMPFAQSGTCILGRGDTWTLTRCEEMVEVQLDNGQKKSYNVVVGAVAPSGLDVSYHHGAYRSVCVVPVRRFFRS